MEKTSKIWFQERVLVGKGSNNKRWHMFHLRESDCLKFRLQSVKDTPLMPYKTEAP